jgi:hypothetical protein
MPMRKLILPALCLTAALSAGLAQAEDVIVFTAHQDWLSRIYILRMNGSVINYFEYSFYRFNDVEVVDNQLYVAEAFAPRAYRVDIQNGALETIIDDWSLYYFYDLAFDGDYFYVDEWDLNRYDINGVKDGTASFDATVFGSAWDGAYLWTLNDVGVMQAWDVSGWPDVIPAPVPDMTPPSDECRGLWFDGAFFWTAESHEGLGYIYQFDHHGQIVNQWLEPAYYGWGACVIRDPAADVEADAASPDTAPRLLLDCPQPFRPGLTLRCVLPERARVTLQMFGQSGELVGTLARRVLDAGEHRLAWDAAGLPNGVYFGRLTTSHQAANCRVVLAR